MLGRAGAGTRGVAALSGGLIFAAAAVEVLKQVVGDFEPRRTVHILIIVTVGLLGLTFNRARVLLERLAARRERNRQLDADLAIWPLRTFDELNAYYLGVFPVPAGHADGGHLGPYLERDADGEIRDAIRTEPFLVVFGPPRGGKSRTTYDAARQELARAWAVLPEGPDELARLLDIEPPLDFGSGTAVLWLDSLDRFLPSLDLDLMDAARRGGLHIVATVRESAYQAMLEASGQEGELGRRILSRARGIHLPATLSAREEDAARVQFPKRAPGSPLGGDVAEILRGGHGPARRPRGESSLDIFSSEPRGRRSWPWDRLGRRWRARRTWWSAYWARRRHLKRHHVRAGTDVNPKLFRVDRVLVVELVVLAAVGVWLWQAIRVRFADPDPPSLEMQLQTVEESGPGVPSTHTVFLRGPEQKSYLISYRPVSIRDSDELRVYDQSGESIGGAPVFRFRPEPVAGAGWRFFLRNKQIDVDRDGADDAVGAFRSARGATNTVLPVVLYRRKGGARAKAGYTIKALVRPASGFGKPKRLEDPGGTTRVVGAGAVTDFAVVRMNDTVKLLLGSRTATGFQRGLVSPIHIDAFLLGTTRGRAERGLHCTAFNRNAQRVSVDFRSKPGPLAPQLVARWRNYDATAACGNAA
jgi:hypothetical protein